MADKNFAERLKAKLETPLPLDLQDLEVSKKAVTRKTPNSASSEVGAVFDLNVEATSSVEVEVVQETKELGSVPSSVVPEVVPEVVASEAQSVVVVAEKEAVKSAAPDKSADKAGEKKSVERPVKQVVSNKESSEEDKVPFFLKEKKKKARSYLPEDLSEVTVSVPLPKSWGQKNLNNEDKKMSESEKVEQLNAVPSRRQKEAPSITLPTTERSVNDDMESVSVDPEKERITTVISGACTNNGTIETKEGLLIQGTQVGDVKIDTSELDETGTVVISRTGVVKGNIEGKRIVVFGRVEGSIKSVTHITLADTAVVIGDVYFRTIRMMDGSEIEGSCQKLKQDEM